MGETKNLFLTPSARVPEIHPDTGERNGHKAQEYLDPQNGGTPSARIGTPSAEPCQSGGAVGVYDRRGETVFQDILRDGDNAEELGDIGGSVADRLFEKDGPRGNIHAPVAGESAPGGVGAVDSDAGRGTTGRGIHQRRDGM